MRHPIRLWLSAVLVLGAGATPGFGEDEATVLRLSAKSAGIKSEGGPVEGAWNLWSNGRVGQRVRIPTSGSYTVIVRAWGSPADRTWPEMGLLVDELQVQSVTVDRESPLDYRFKVQLEAGPHEIAASFANDARTANEDRNLYLKEIAITAPGGTPRR